MGLITIFLGLILFLPNYAIALDERLETKKQFKPFDILYNLKKSKRASLPLSTFGVGLCILGCGVLILYGGPISISTNDKIKGGAALLTLWLGFYLCYMQEYLLNRGHKKKDLNGASLLASSDKECKLYALAKSTKDMALVAISLSALVLFTAYIIKQLSPS